MNRSHELLSEQRSNETNGSVGGRRDVWTWQGTGAACGLLGGILAALTGSLMLAAAWLTGHQDGGLSLYGIGSGLLLSMIPLLILGAHCLDLSDRRETRPQRHNQDRPHAVANGHGHTRARFAGASALLLLLCGFFATTQAQQTIFNVPSSDVLFRGNLYSELDVTFKPNDGAGNSVGRFSSFVPRVVAGVGRGVEIGLNVTGNIQPGADSTTLVPAIKWKAYDGGDNGWAIVVGDNVFIPVRNKSYDVGNYFYAQVSKTFKTKTRLTAGGYHFSRNVVAPNAQRAGGQFGFEQPVTDKFGVAADWYTGKHAAGYFTPGINFKPHPKVTGYFGYSIGNSGASNGNHFVYTAVGVNFN
ncbi:MAG: hypothetical protein H7Z38_09600 [Rubrivivax sp.]|nr:hypothetical protein [Pyrinomonadaceae bacterium]